MREDTSSYGNKKDKGKDPMTDAKVNEKTIDKSSMIEKEYVFLYKAGMAYLKEVETGIQDNNFIEITKGLQAGEEIIYGPYSAISKILKNKTPVNKVDKEELYVERNGD
jgi:HlyD family secretion protein